MAAKEIGRLLIEGQICAAQLSNTRDAYKVCIDDHHPSLAWWQQPTTVIGGVTVTFSLGLILGLTHCFGGCK